MIRDICFLLSSRVCLYLFIRLRPPEQPAVIEGGGPLQLVHGILCQLDLTGEGRGHKGYCVLPLFSWWHILVVQSRHLDIFLEGKRREGGEWGVEGGEGALKNPWFEKMRDAGYHKTLWSLHSGIVYWWKLLSWTTKLCMFEKAVTWCSVSPVSTKWHWEMPTELANKYHTYTIILYPPTITLYSTLHKERGKTMTMWNSLKGLEKYTLSLSSLEKMQHFQSQGLSKIYTLSFSSLEKYIHSQLYWFRKIDSQPQWLKKIDSWPHGT